MNKIKNIVGLILSSLIITGCNPPNTIDYSKDTESHLHNINIKKDINNSLKLENNDTDSPLNIYGLSINFFNSLKKYVNDNVLNKSEIDSLLLLAGSEKERNFINSIKSKNSFLMTNHKSDSSEPDTLDFIINKDFNIDGSFLKSIYKNNHTIKINDVSSLYSTATSEEKKYLDNLIKYDSYKILSFDHNNNIKEITIDTSYQENSIIPGQNISEIISNIGQGDKLPETDTDNFRCGASVIINSILYLKGINGFYDISKKMNLNFSEITYQNIHLAQDMLMKKVNSNDSGLSIAYTTEGRLLGGSFLEAVKFSGLNWDDNLIKKSDNSYKKEIENYFREYPNSTLIAGVYLDKSNGEIKFNDFTNHYALITHRNNKYYINNTGNKNGTGKNNYELSEKELNQLYITENTLIKILS